MAFEAGLLLLFLLLLLLLLMVKLIYLIQKFGHTKILNACDIYRKLPRPRHNGCHTIRIDSLLVAYISSNTTKCYPHNHKNKTNENTFFFLCFSLKIMLLKLNNYCSSITVAKFHYVFVAKNNNKLLKLQMNKKKKPNH